MKKKALSDKDIIRGIQAPLETGKEAIEGIQPEPEKYTQRTFLPILHNAAMNELAAMSNAPITQRDTITSESMIKGGNISLFIEKYGDLLAPRCSVFKLFDVFCVELAKINDYRSAKGAQHTTVTISLDSYMTLCGLDPAKKPLKDKTRRRVHEDLDYLYRFSLEWTDPRGGKHADFKKQRICSAAFLEKGVITFTFAEALANSLNSAFIGQYPTAIFRLDDRNKNAYPLARKIAMHACIDSNKQKGTAYILSVESLLSVCPDIPNYQTIGEKSNRSFTQKIREPLEKALDSLAEFTAWEYCNPKGKPLTEDQLEAKDWNTYSKFLVKFTFREEPDQEARLARKAARTGKKKAKQKKQQSI